MAVKSMQVLYVGSDHVDKRRIIYGISEETMVDTVFLCFLIRTDDGNILVDAGVHPADVEALNAMGFNAKVRTEDHLPQRLKEVGLSMEDINMVLITHLHFDHCGWAADLPNAELVIQKEEYHFAFNPPPYAAAGFYLERFKSPEIKWRIVEGDQVLMPGITLLFTPGHTPGSQSVMVDLPKFGPVLLVGDAGILQENFEKELLPTPFSCEPMQAWYSIRRLKVWSQIRKAPIFTTHDIDFWRQEMIKPPEAYT